MNRLELFDLCFSYHYLTRSLVTLRACLLGLRACLLCPVVTSYYFYPPAVSFHLENMGVQSDPTSLYAAPGNAADENISIRDQPAPETDQRGYRILEQPMGTRRKVKAILMGAGASSLNFFKRTATPAIWGYLKDLEDFKGKLMHSAHYEEGYELSGKRVAVIGAGSSGVQIVAAIQAHSQGE
ncbi:hypothetical protein P280DRAFT_512461 [Massarina eburnea CBS 473.64]|uniref:FAD/NAD(P)-binding domain-containing protein n=1 Tax=Massarina eburnea CBS 473.64 TaxID=1395130 RepID=A0A6A6SEL8_9PLEO|nr:hypothetical protein P280DRAFT_512461 [Massarina eburnea CBS 473.64]